MAAVILDGGGVGAPAHSILSVLALGVEAEATNRFLPVLRGPMREPGPRLGEPVEESVEPDDSHVRVLGQRRAGGNVRVAAHHGVDVLGETRMLWSRHQSLAGKLLQQIGQRVGLLAGLLVVVAVEHALGTVGQLLAPQSIGLGDQRQRDVDVLEFDIHAALLGHDQ